MSVNPDQCPFCNRICSRGYLEKHKLNCKLATIKANDPSFATCPFCKVMYTKRGLSPHMGKCKSRPQPTPKPLAPKSVIKIKGKAPFHSEPSAPSKDSSVVDRASASLKPVDYKENDLVESYRPRSQQAVDSLPIPHCKKSSKPMPVPHAFHAIAPSDKKIGSIECPVCHRFLCPHALFFLSLTRAKLNQAKEVLGAGSPTKTSTEVRSPTSTSTST